MSDLPPLATLINPHFLCVGPRSQEAVRMWVEHYRQEADIWVIARSETSLNQQFHPSWEDASRLRLSLKIFANSDGIEILRQHVRDVLRRHNADEKRLQEADGAITEIEMARHIAVARPSVPGGRRISLEEAPIGTNLALCNEHLRTLNLPPIAIEDDIGWVVVRNEQEGRTLTRYGVRPHVDDLQVKADLRRRTLDLAQFYPKATADVVEMAARTQQEAEMWKLALAMPSDARDATGGHDLSFVTALERDARLKDIEVDIRGLYDGTKPLETFKTGDLRFIDITKCTAARINLLMLDIIRGAAALLDQPRWRYLVIDETAFAGLREGVNELVDLTRQGRKAGLGLLISDTRGTTVPPEVVVAVGNVIAFTDDPTSVGMPMDERRERLAGIRDQVQQYLRAEWRADVPADRAEGVSANYQDDILGEIFENDQVVYWKQPGTNAWREPGSINPDYYQRVLERGRFLLTALAAVVSYKGQAEWWNYTVGQSKSVALTEWQLRNKA